MARRQTAKNTKPKLCSSCASVPLVPSLVSHISLQKIACLCNNSDSCSSLLDSLSTPNRIDSCTCECQLTVELPNLRQNCQKGGTRLSRCMFMFSTSNTKRFREVVGETEVLWNGTSPKVCLHHGKQVNCWPPRVHTNCKSSSHDLTCTPQQATESTATGTIIP